MKPKHDKYLKAQEIIDNPPPVSKHSKTALDKYLKARGGKYKIYNIHCAECGALLFKYQKDGSGVLKRCYLDRISDFMYHYSHKLPVNFIIEGHEIVKDKWYICKKCWTRFGVLTTYKPENRPAIRLFVGAVRKRRVKV